MTGARAAAHARPDAAASPALPRLRANIREIYAWIDVISE